MRIASPGRCTNTGCRGEAFARATDPGADRGPGRGGGTGGNLVALRIQFIVGVLDIPVATQTRVLTVKIVQQNVEIPQVQFLGWLLARLLLSVGVDSGGASASVHRQRACFLVEQRQAPRDKLWRIFQRSSSWTRSLRRPWKIHDFPREGEPGSRVAPGRWTLFLPVALASVYGFWKNSHFYVDSAGCSHMEIWTIFQRAHRMTC